MKKWVILIIFVVALAGIYFTHYGQDSVPEVASGQRCFVYTHAATESEPYNVEEHVALNIAEGVVAGTKRGTQSGPDMVNGYEGTLKGSIEENMLEVIFAYTIEGSQNSELEIYELTENALIKNRWPLKQENGMLVPDKTGEPSLLTYTEEAC